MAVERGLRAIALCLISVRAEQVEVPRQYQLALGPDASEAEVLAIVFGGDGRHGLQQWLDHADGLVEQRGGRKRQREE